LSMPNCVIAPEVWDYQRVCALAALGRPIADVLVSLSVIHHIDNLSTNLYTAERLTHEEGTLCLMARLLELAPRHFIELPDRPWIEHIYVAYGTARAFLNAAAAASGRHWSFIGPLCVSEWYGRRELWLLEEVGQTTPAIPPQGMKALFSRTLGPPVDQTNNPAMGARRPSAPVGMAPRATVVPQQQQQQQQQQQHPQLQQPQSQQQQLLQQRQELQNRGAFDQPAGAVHGQQLVGAQLGAALLAAPTALIAAHVQLRDACAAAEVVLNDAKAVGG